MEKLKNILTEIENVGGKCYFVGGSVRDKLLKAEIYDYDIEIYNIDFKSLIEVLHKFGELIVNYEFYTVKIKKIQNYEFSLPRLEETTGLLHTDFKVVVLEEMDFCKASMRRDFTINSILMEYSTSTIIDCYDGKNDLKSKNIRHVSDKFIEDPLRVLRAVRFSSKLGFTIDESTLQLCIQMTRSLDTISNERFSKEFAKFVVGEYFDIGINYFIYLLSQYFNIKIFDIQKLQNLKLCCNTEVRCLILFYLLKGNELEFMINRCIDKKSVRKKIQYLLNNNLEDINDFYELTLKFTKKEILLLYKYIKNECIENLYIMYENLSKKYSAKYFIDLGYEGVEISVKIKESIINGLKEGK
ncbi:MAG: hypothetical protein ACK5K7_07580 [Bacilli bacterium]